jgi:hypothetical protein
MGATDMSTGSLASMPEEGFGDEELGSTPVPSPEQNSLRKTVRLLNRLLWISLAVTLITVSGGVSVALVVSRSSESDSQSPVESEQSNRGIPTPSPKPSLASSLRPTMAPSIVKPALTLVPAISKCPHAPDPIDIPHEDTVFTEELPRSTYDVWMETTMSLGCEDMAWTVLLTCQAYSRAFMNHSVCERINPSQYRCRGGVEDTLQESFSRQLSMECYGEVERGLHISANVTAGGCPSRGIVRLSMGAQDACRPDSFALDPHVETSPQRCQTGTPLHDLCVDTDVCLDAADDCPMVTEVEFVAQPSDTDAASMCAPAQPVPPVNLPPGHRCGTDQACASSICLDSLCWAGPLCEGGMCTAAHHCQSLECSAAGRCVSPTSRPDDGVPEIPTVGSDDTFPSVRNINEWEPLSQQAKQLP